MSTYTQSYEQGRSAALIVYILYLLSIPSASVFALVGVIVAYVAAPSASGLAALHLREQIRVWWQAFWWTVIFIILGAISAALVIVLIGIPLLWLVGVAFFVLMIWFTVKAVLGLLALLNGAAP